MEKWRNERDLKLDFFSTQRGSSGQGRYLVEGTCELRYSFNECRALQRALSRFAPPASRLLDQTRLSKVTREQFGLVLGNLDEFAFERFSNASVKRTSRFT
jgi:hypothetical protein